MRARRHGPGPLAGHRHLPRTPPASVQSAALGRPLTRRHHPPHLAQRQMGLPRNGRLLGTRPKPSRRHTAPRPPTRRIFPLLTGTRSCHPERSEGPAFVFPVSISKKDGCPRSGLSDLGKQRTPTYQCHPEWSAFGVPADEGSGVSEVICFPCSLFPVSLKPPSSHYPSTIQAASVSPP